MPAPDRKPRRGAEGGKRSGRAPQHTGSAERAGAAKRSGAAKRGSRDQRRGTTKRTSRNRDDRNPTRSGVQHPIPKYRRPGGDEPAADLASRSSLRKVGGTSRRADQPVRKPRKQRSAP